MNRKQGRGKEPRQEWLWFQALTTQYHHCLKCMALESSVPLGKKNIQVREDSA